MPTSTVEDYLKAILLQEERQGGGDLVTMGQISSALEVAPGTVTSMVKTLEKEGHVRYEPYSGVRLSDEGRRLAVHVLRRHRLVELFLVETLGLDWSEVHEEAEQLEHAMSDKLVDRIDAHLGFPEVDPHGDPIPNGDGTLRRVELRSLDECLPGEALVVARVSDQDEEFLRFVERHGLKPGSRIVILRRDPHADAVTVKPDGHSPVTLGVNAATKLWTERPPGDPR
ncbi:MAG: metal-dependent transcriptional regulator [Acidobacteriota bacterium]